MTDEQVYAGVEKALRKYFGKRGDRVVQDNLTCVKRGYSEMQEIPQAVIKRANVSAASSDRCTAVATTLSICNRDTIIRSDLIWLATDQLPRR